MSDIPSSLAKIQIEGTQFRAPVSESMLQAMGGSINGLIDQDTINSAKILYIINALTPVGSYIHSSLTEAQFQAQSNVYGVQWILAAGQTVTGSNYHTITGNTVVPDMRGVFLRGKNNGRSGATGNSAGDLALGTYQSDGNAPHVHTTNVNDPGHNHNTTVDAKADAGASVATLVWETNKNTPNTFTFTSTSSNTGVTVDVNSTGDESRPRNVTVNIFIRIN